MLLASQKWPRSRVTVSLQREIEHGGTRFMTLEGTVSRDFFTLVFFHQTTFLVPLDTLRKGFRIFSNIWGDILYVIDFRVFTHHGVDSPRYVHHRGVVTSRCIHHRGVETTRWWILKWVDLNWSTKKELVQNSSGVDTLLWLLHLGALLPGFLHRKVFFWTYSDACFKYINNSPQGSRDSPVSFYRFSVAYNDL